MAKLNNIHIKLKKRIMIFLMIVLIFLLTLPKFGYALEHDINTTENNTVDYIISDNPSEKVIINGKPITEWIVYNKQGSWAKGENNRITMKIINNSPYEFKVIDYSYTYEDENDKQPEDFYKFELLNDYTSQKKQPWRMSNKVLGYLFYNEYKIQSLSKEELNSIEEQIINKSQEIQQTGGVEQEINTYAEYILYFYNYIYENKPDNPVTELKDMDNEFIKDLFDPADEIICVEEHDQDIIKLGKDYFYSSILKIGLRNNKDISSENTETNGYWNDEDYWESQIDKCFNIIPKGEIEVEISIGTDYENMGNAYLGTPFLKGLKFEIVLEKIVPEFSYSIEYYRDKVTSTDDKKHFIASKKGIAKMGTILQTNNPNLSSTYLNIDEFRPYGYEKGKLVTKSLIIDTNDKVIKILYSKLEEVIIPDKDNDYYDNNDSSLDGEVGGITDLQEQPNDEKNQEEENTLKIKYVFDMVIFIILAIIAFRSTNIFRDKD